VGQPGVGGGHGSHAHAFIGNLGSSFAGGGHRHGGRWHFEIGDHRFNAGHFLGQAGVNRLDVGMGVRAELDAGKELLAGQHVAGEIPVTGDDAVGEMVQVVVLPITVMDW